MRRLQFAVVQTFANLLSLHPDAKTPNSTALVAHWQENTGRARHGADARLAECTCGRMQPQGWVHLSESHQGARCAVNGAELEVRVVLRRRDCLRTATH